MTALLVLGVIGGIALFYGLSGTSKPSRAVRTERFQLALTAAMKAAEQNDLHAYRVNLAAASAQLDVSKGPTLKDEQALGMYQSILYNPQQYTAQQILSFAGMLQAQGYDYEAGNLILLEMNLVR